MSLALSIEHTVLRADATSADVDVLCTEALEYGFVGVCVNPIHVPRAARALGGSCLVVSVVGFPLGAGSEASDVAETAWLVSNGADEIDLVIPIGLARAAEWDAVTRRVRAVRVAAEGRPLKVILETGLFTPNELERVCAAVMEAEPAYLKTSTGFGPRGASVEDVQLLVRCSAGRAQVKASGGIRVLEDARALLAAGATRLGTSRGVELVRAERHGPSRL